MRKEIEVKAKVENLDELAHKLEALGCVISEPKRQDDIIFVNYSEPYDQAMPGANFLRIRKSGGKILFTVKQPQTNELDCYEREVEISDADEMYQAILLLGYHEACRVGKTRRTAKHGEYEICLDEIDGLGAFVEVEKIAEDVEAEKVQNELFAFLETLGIDENDRVINGYDTLVYRKSLEVES